MKDPPVFFGQKIVKTAGKEEYLYCILIRKYNWEDENKMKL